MIRKLKRLLLASTLCLLMFGPAAPALAFHDGGAAPCEGCHTMHNTGGGLPLPGAANPKLLQAATPSSVCLICHQGTVAGGHRVATADILIGPGLPPGMMTPGGDFAWLKKDYSWVAGTVFETEAGESHGHNIVAPDFGYVADLGNPSAPGGTFPAAALQCTSCHDPHGRYRVRADGTTAAEGPPVAGSGSLSVAGVPANPVAGQSSVGSYRLLAGAGYQPAESGVVFNYGPPAAMAPDDYNRSEAVTQTRVAYGDGTSRWCANCHGQFHDGSLGAFQHGFEAPLGLAADHYNAYVKTGDLSGLYATAYSSLVPFESRLTNTPADRLLLAGLARSDDANLTGAAATDVVGCLTCHRAHASGWRHALRWNQLSPLLVESGLYPGIDNGAPAEDAMGRTEAETRRSYYDRPAALFAADQERLCAKCHAEGVPAP